MINTVSEETHIRLPERLLISCPELIKTVKELYQSSSFHFSDTSLDDVMEIVVNACSFKEAYVEYIGEGVHAISTMSTLEESDGFVDVRDPLMNKALHLAGDMLNKQLTVMGMYIGDYFPYDYERIFDGCIVFNKEQLD